MREVGLTYTRLVLSFIPGLDILWHYVKALYILPGNDLQQNACKSYAIHNNNYDTWI